MTNLKKIKVFNTLGRDKQILEPQTDDLVRVYSCGLTVYDYAHIGNLRKYIFDDLLIRTLKYFGYATKHVQNITDVGHLTSDSDEGEDKIEKGAEREHKTAHEVARFYEEAFLADMEKLNILHPDIMPRATEHIEEQIELIKTLEEKGFTYKTSDGIYFDTSKIDDYGKLAGLDIEGLKEGARVERNLEKKNPTDFALWKFSVPEDNRQMEWDSPWGVGFPGWHIECSAMSVKYLGQPFEIHTGGVDHINVHHTNEIAQSEAAGEKPLAKYWMHSDYLLENGRKMAKSDGHFIRLTDLEEKGFSPLDFRFLCLSAHYRSKLNFTWESLKSAKEAREKLLQFSRQLNDEEGENGLFEKALGDFEDAIVDDLDTPKALAIIFETISLANKDNHYGINAKKFIKAIDKILGLNLVSENDNINIKRIENDSRYIKSFADIPEEIQQKAMEREIKRREKDFEAADKLRQAIENAGFVLEDFIDHTLVKKG